MTVVLSEAGGSYLAFSEALREKLTTDRFALNTKRVDEAAGDSDLYVAVGMKAASELANRNLPTLNVLVPKAGYDKLSHESASHSTPRSAIYIDQPMERQVSLLLAALPDTRHVGLLYANLPPELPVLRRLLADRNVRLHDRQIDQAHSLNDTLESVLGESEVLFVLPDAEIYNTGTIRNILLTAYRKQVPLIGISQAYVKAGALCAIFSTPEQAANQAAAMIQRYAESGRLPAAQYPADFEVLVNTQVARSLDLRIEDTDKLRAEIRRVP
ncbi:MAG TPA: ABC transporter substrate binding protein [Sideroxyarcus sp.]|nr:ABC transporter substrate binding protein [Sideroxyarcus sp.]